MVILVANYEWYSYRFQLVECFLNYQKFIVDKKKTKKRKKKRIAPIYFNTNYPTEMKMVPVIMDYCLLQFGALKFF